jgi:glycosyltransferase involved in cell wall biosynthesis
VSEVVENEITGFICEAPSDLPEAIKRAELIDPSECRDRARVHFDVAAMVSRYESVYRQVTSPS